MLTAYEERYDVQVRRAGRLMFGDLPLLLAPSDGRVLLGGKAPDRLDLEYRLDGEFDHWLLDEFQDTSTVQWRAVENLIDEVVQDPSGERTFFCVGDQKQSIYQWRGGDPRLFDRVKKKYDQGTGDEFKVDSLNKSWRSCPDVLRMVNQVFGNAEKLETSEIWGEHKSAKNRVGEKGHSLYLQVDDKEDRWPVVAQLLKKLQPINNRLECAILVQSNRAARDLVNHLRGAGLGMPIVGESATNPGADNPLGMALLSLFRAAAHPEDGFSAGHVGLTPSFCRRKRLNDSRRCGIFNATFTSKASRLLPGSGSGDSIQNWTTLPVGVPRNFSSWLGSSTKAAAAILTHFCASSPRRKLPKPPEPAWCR